MNHVEEMKSSNIGGVSEGVIEQVKKTKNTSIKNLTVLVFKDENQIETHTIKNMYQTWRFIEEHYNEDKNLKNTIQVYHNGNLLKEIHAEKKSSGAIWKIDRMNIGSHKKEK